MNGAHQQALARAETLMELERWHDALRALAPALGDDETAASAYCMKAGCHLGLGQLDEAETAARRAAGLAPQEEWPHRLLALALLRSGKRREAEREAAEAARLEPDSPHALHVLAVSQASLFRGGRDARRTAEAAVEANPHSSLSHHTLAIIALAQGDAARAESAYRDALRLDPHDPELSLGLAQSLRAQGKRDEAADAYLAASRVDPTNPEIRRGLGKLGVPVVGGVALFAIKLGVLQGARLAVVDLGDPRAVGLVAALALALGCALTVFLRVRGTRGLPEPVREGLRVDHVDHALAWVFGAGLVAFLLALWAAFASPDNGGGAATTLVFVAIAVALVAVAVHYSSTTPILPGLGRRARFWSRRLRR